MKSMSLIRRAGVFLLPLLLAFKAWAITPALAPGEIRQVTLGESMSQANSLYQQQAAGLPKGQTVAVGVDRSVSRTGYVKFDGINQAAGKLYDAKGFGYRVDQNGRWTDSMVSRKMQEKLVKQAERQLAAARLVNMKVEWRVPTQAIRAAMQTLLRGQITVTVSPPSQEVLDALKGIGSGSGSF